MKYQFCPNCGIEYQQQSNFEALSCNSCKYIFYQNSKPTASALFRNGNLTLLGKRKVEPSKGMWDIIGGFLNPGEDPITGVIREVKEETGLEVKVIKFAGIEMDVYSKLKYNTLNIFYEVEIIGGNEQAGDDIEELKWFPFDQLPDDVAFENGKRALYNWAASIS